MTYERYNSHDSPTEVPVIKNDIENTYQIESFNKVTQLFAEKLSTTSQ